MRKRVCHIQFYKSALIDDDHDDEDDEFEFNYHDDTLEVTPRYHES